MIHHFAVARLTVTMQRLRNYVGGEWVEADTERTQKVLNPATEEVLAEVPLGGAVEVDRAARAAQAAYAGWRATPAVQRAHYLFDLKFLLEKHADEIARTLTAEHGKTLSESKGSVRRGIECVEVACGAPSLLMGDTLEDVASGIDCQAVRQPLGVFACIAPFNFPALIRHSIPLQSYPTPPESESSLVRELRTS